MESSLSTPEREALKGIAGMWWLWIVIGVIWIGIAVVILQFDQASITTVGVLIGLMFFGAAMQQFLVFSIVESLRWLYALFGILFTIAGILSLISPENTFAAIADLLGFLFLLIGIFWIITAFIAREISELWWVGLLAGIVMIVIAFWTGGQFFFEKQYVLLAFAGIWALMEGVTDLIRAFQIRKLGEYV